ncbi:hypothetical protein PR202_gb27365 [Eleusine coracana subsp. coracana]|uniref:NB-ARC domain-containing protein n=1 Tax=Eleusine coracana subsp. coracana TaxID=191504 RepID=A0AAV5FV54_ELECO|nr:hypothetical protein PR202_gb27365 [Eleusine coracana subsp. coracana]
MGCGRAAARHADGGLLRRCPCSSTDLGGERGSVSHRSGRGAGPFRTVDLGRGVGTKAAAGGQPTQWGVAMPEVFPVLISPFETMAMVVETFIPNFISLLTQIAAREESAVRRFVDVREEFERTLVELKNFNADIVWRSTDGTVTASLRDIKDVLYNAADMDIFQLKYDKRRGGCYAFSHRMLQTPRDMKSLHTVLLLNKKLKHIIGQSERYRFTSYINPYEDRRVGHHASRMKHSSIVQLSDVVGVQIEETMWGLLDIMLREIENPGANIKIIAIVGAAGIGKSTLAKKIFDSKICHNHFDLPIWLNVTRSFDNVDLLKSILRSSYDNMGSYGSVDIPHLVTKIGEFIHGRRVLLVLDDVWSSTLWNDLLRAIFSHSRCGGTVILVTTRNTQVAADMEATHVHKVEKLNTEAAWSLLKKKAEKD